MLCILGQKQSNKLTYRFAHYVTLHQELKLHSTNDTVDDGDNKVLQNWVNLAKTWCSTPFVHITAIPISADMLTTMHSHKILVEIKVPILNPRKLGGTFTIINWYRYQCPVTVLSHNMYWWTNWTPEAAMATKN